THLFGALDQYAPRLDVAPTGAIWAANSFQGTMSYAGGSLESAGDFDIYVLRLAPDGGVDLALRHGGAGVQTNEVLAATPSGGVALAGLYDGVFELDGHALPLVGGQDLYVAELSPDGERLWSLAAGGAFFDEPEDITVDA